jgi:hypothetical protein
MSQPELAGIRGQPAGISCKYLFSPSFLVGSWRQASRHIETGCCISQSRQYVRSRRCCRFDRRSCFVCIAGVPLGVTARRVALRLRRSALSRSCMRKVRALVLWRCCARGCRPLRFDRLSSFVRRSKRQRVSWLCMHRTRVAVSSRDAVRQEVCGHETRGRVPGLRADFIARIVFTVQR